MSKHGRGEDASVELFTAAVAAAAAVAGVALSFVGGVALDCL